MNPGRRRLVAVGITTVVAPSIAFGQKKPARIGYLANNVRVNAAPMLAKFHTEMGRLGYREGIDYVLIERYAEGHLDRLPVLAADLVQSVPDIILTVGSSITRVAQKATSTIPIVIVTGGDPVGGGLVKSLARPGGNITGNTNSLTDVAPKQFELLLEAAPKLSRVALLMRTTYTHRETLKSLLVLAPSKKVEVIPVEADTLPEIEKGFSAMVAKKAGGLIMVSDPIYAVHIRRIAALAIANRLPSICLFREYVEAGMMMSYGPSNAYLYERAAGYVDRILKGAKPADLPIEQATKFELVVSLQNAKAIGVTIMPSLLLRADEVIR